MNGYSWICIAAGGCVGSILAAFVTEYLDPHYSFLICEVIYGLMTLAALNISEIKRADSDFTTVNSTLSHLVVSLKKPAVYGTLIYFMLVGIVVPSFADVNYFFTLNVLHYSKFTVSMLNFISSVTMLVGTMIYNRYFRDYEIRTMI